MTASSPPPHCPWLSLEFAVKLIDKPCVFKERRERKTLCLPRKTSVKQVLPGPQAPHNPPSVLSSTLEWLSTSTPTYSLSSFFLVAQGCLTLSDPMDCKPSGSSVHGISQARILEWVAISFSMGSSQQGSNLGLPHGRQTLYHLSHQGRPSALVRLFHHKPK